jgi:hypothetical protein
VTVCFLLFRVFGTCSHPECVVELLLETPFTKKQKERKKERKKERSSFLLAEE